MLLAFISYIPAAIGLILIGLVTYVKNYRNKLNLYFFLLCILLSAWLGGLFIADISTDHGISLWAIRFAAGIGSLAVPVLFLFSTYFPIETYRPNKYIRMLVILPALVFLVLALAGNLVPSIEIKNGSAQPSNLGAAYFWQSIYSLVGFIGAFVVLFSKLSRVGARQKSQIQFVIVGFIFALAINILSGVILTLLGDSNDFTNLIGGISLVVFVASTAFAIIRYRLFDIRLAIVRSLGLILTLSVSISIYALLLIGVIIPIITKNALEIDSAVTKFVLVIPTIVIAFTYQVLKKVLVNATVKVFYSSDYDLKKALDQLSDALLTDNNMDKIMKQTSKVLQGSLRPSSFTLAAVDTYGKIYGQYTFGKMSIPESTFINIAMLAKQTYIQNPFSVEESSDSKLSKLLIKEDVLLLLKLGDKKNITGLLLLGQKQNGGMYTSKDLDFLRIGSKNIGIALENAKKYDQISRFADTLNTEVKRATSSLRKANDELKTLDALKDDFIHMASHQLRTPATSVHQALQMLNHPSLSKSDRKEIIELAEASSEHLVTVVADMLSIARIQAGQLILSKTRENFIDIVEKVISQTTVLANQKAITIKKNFEANDLHCEIDVPKMSEAIGNYIENAIKYSPEETSVNVHIYAKSNHIFFEVTDSGIGVPEPERAKLFGKFYRAKNAREEQPDGNGIGLFVVKSIAEGHGGEAYYRPLDKGSLFGIWVPMVQ